MITTPLAAGQAPPSSEHQWSTHHHLWSRAAWLNLHKFIANIIESICICLVFAFCFTCAFMYTSKNIKTQQQQAQRITFNQSQSISQSINQPNSLPKTWLYYVDILASHWYSHLHFGFWMVREQSKLLRLWMCFTQNQPFYLPWTNPSKSWLSLYLRKFYNSIVKRS